MPVYNLNLRENKQSSEMPNEYKQNQSIINYKHYLKSHNFNIKLFRAEGKNSFYARKRALVAHKLICIEPYCEICNISEKIKTFIYTASNLARYNQTIESSPKLTLSRKRVRFAERKDYEILEKTTNIELNLMNLFRACEQNISFKELTLLKIT